jgi:glyoxylase-like metal-dependent hydrolase (beta-lactamase superfamily II)
MPETRIHRHSTGPEGALVNAYLVETGEGIVALDGTLTVSDGRALRAQLESLGKPLLAVLVTHAHPDHYGGIVELVAGDDVPVVATVGVDAVIRRDDALKEEILRPMFGEEGLASARSPIARSWTERAWTSVV